MLQDRIVLRAKSRRIMTFTIVLVLTAFVLNYFMRDHLYNYSIVAALRLQRTETITSNTFFNFMMVLADPRLVGLIFVITNLICKDKNRVLALLLYFLGWIWVSVVLKTMYADPRPFWTTSRVQNLADNCPLDYGNPFGSSITSILLFQPLVIQFVGLGKYCLHLVLPLILCILIPIAGFYLGLASINQILLGVILNLSALIMWKLYFSGLLTTFLDQVNRYSERGRGMMINTFFLHMTTIVIPLALFLHRPKPKLERIVLINVGTACEVIPSALNSTNFEMLLLSAFINVCFGYCYGFYMDAKTGRHETKRWSLPEGFWWLKLLIDSILVVVPAFLTAYIYQNYTVSASYLSYLLICGVYIWVGYIQIRWSPKLRTLESINPLAFQN